MNDLNQLRRAFNASGKFRDASALVTALEAEVERLTARETELEGDPKMALTWGDLNAALGNAQDRGLDHPQDAGTLAPMRERLRNALAALVAGEERYTTERYTEEEVPERE